MSAARRAFDLSLYLVTDAALIGGRPLADIVAAAVRGGVTLVQLRDKAAPTRALIAQARALQSVLKPAGVPLLINDRVDVAWAAGADGVHVGSEDMPPALARQLLGPEAIIGQSVGSEAELAALDPAIVDYAGVGAVAATPTKADADALSPEAFADLRRRLSVPVVAIGGLNLDTLARPLAAGADGIAVVSAICAAADPEAAARALRAAVEAAKSARPEGRHA